MLRVTRQVLRMEEEWYELPYEHYKWEKSIMSDNTTIASGRRLLRVERQVLRADRIMSG